MTAFYNLIITHLRHMGKYPSNLLFILTVVLCAACSSPKTYYPTDNCLCCEAEGITCPVRINIYDTVGIKNGHQYVDLGLPSGTLWATCNIGAKLPEDEGDRFVWGNTEPYIRDSIKRGNIYIYVERRVKQRLETLPEEQIGRDIFNEDLVDKYRRTERTTYEKDGQQHTSIKIIWTKYCEEDKKTELDLEDDAANALWGGHWRIPTQEQYKELLDTHYTHYLLLTLHGVFGCLITSKVEGHTDKSIFIPAADFANFRRVSSTKESEPEGHYFSRTVSTFYTNATFHESIPLLDFRASGGEASCSSSSARNLACAIRPVWEP